MSLDNMYYKRHRCHRVEADLSHFWAITVLSNSPRFERRYENYWAFKDMCDAAGIQLITVELQLGTRGFMITEAGNSHHVQLRTIDELWHKENLINIGVQRAMQIDPKVSKVAWIDADIRPMSPPRYWFEETWHELEHSEFVQMFEYLVDLDSDYNPLTNPSMSFMASYHRGGRHIPVAQPGKPIGSYVKPGDFWLGPPGGAWAANIDAYKAVGGLIDFCILGSADWHMAQGLLGILQPKKGENWSSRYAEKLFNWQERALKWIKKDVGFVKGGILHDNHGPKFFRYYVSRKKILVESEYDPNRDIKYDPQGVLQLETHSERQIKLRDDIKAYFRARNEDMPEYKKLKMSL